MGAHIRHSTHTPVWTMTPDRGVCAGGGGRGGQRVSQWKSSTEAGKVTLAAGEDEEQLQRLEAETLFQTQ